jgi:hypothetical protein
MYHDFLLSPAMFDVDTFRLSAEVKVFPAGEEVAKRATNERLSINN